MQQDSIDHTIFIMNGQYLRHTQRDIKHSTLPDSDFPENINQVGLVTTSEERKQLSSMEEQLTSGCQPRPPDGLSAVSGQTIPNG
jgi:hypothetical protein